MVCLCVPALLLCWVSALAEVIMKKLTKEFALILPSGNTVARWTDDAKAEMLKRLETIAAPDLILAPNDNVAEGIIEALIEKGYTSFPIITGQDMTDQAKDNIDRY